VNSRERWVRRTRESVMRELAKEHVPLRATDLEDNLDISEYMPSFGFVDRRTEREISAALVWLEKQGYVTSMEYDRDDFDYEPGKHYIVNHDKKTQDFLADCRTFPTTRHEPR